MLTLYTKRLLAFAFLLSFFFDSPPCLAQCSAGNIVHDTIFIPLGSDFQLSVTDIDIPTGHKLAWHFDTSNSDGYGGHIGNGGVYTISNPSLNPTFNNDLNGILSENFGAPLEGNWIMTTRIVDEDFNVCAESEEFIVLDFEKYLCYSGNFVTTGEITVCDGETFDLASTEKFVHPYGYAAWYFNNDHTNGTGGFFNGKFVRGTIDDLNTYSNDIGGYLDGSPNKPPLEGTWVIKAVIVSFDYFADWGEDQFCSISEDSLIVTFNPEIVVTLDNADNTEVIATVIGGIAPYSFTWSNGESGNIATDLSVGELSVVIEDALGCKTESSIQIDGVSSTNQIKNLESLSLFPNPANHEIFLEVYFNTHSNFTIEVLDLYGKKHHEIKISQSKGGKYDFQIQNLPNGTYLLYVKSGLGITTKKFIKL